MWHYSRPTCRRLSVCDCWSNSIAGAGQIFNRAGKRICQQEVGNQACASATPSSAELIWPQATCDAAWKKITQLHADDSTLDKSSLALVASQHPTAWAAGRLAMSKSLVESPVVRMLRTFQGSIAFDTVRNEYFMHSKIHDWLAAEPSPNLAAFNSQVYADLFLTPSWDPWLGLMSDDVYTGLVNDGVVEKP